MDLFLRQFIMRYKGEKILMRESLSKNPPSCLEYLHPMSMNKIDKIFSFAEFGATLPNPTLVRVVKTKYMLVT